VQRPELPIRVLVVDDSALVRSVLATGLGEDPGIQVVGTAENAFVAREKILRLSPTVVTLDVEMPGMDGIEFLRQLMPEHPIPVVMVSALTERGKQVTLDALEAGAVDFVTKPRADISRGLNAMMEELGWKIRIAARANLARWKQQRHPAEAPAARHRALAASTDQIIAVGASTGGTEAIRALLNALPGTTPGMVLVQHMPAGFTTQFARRLNETSAMEVKEAEQNDRVMPGRALLAPGEFHLTVARSGGIYRVNVARGEKVNGHCPSVDVMMHSVAREVGRNAVGVVLTGMGADGAAGLLAMRKAGAATLAQDEATSVVYGMPKVAFENGGAQRVLPLERIPAEILHLVSHERA